MAGPMSKKRKVADGMRGKVHRPAKKFRKQRAYHSSSESDDEVEERDAQGGGSTAEAGRGASIIGERETIDHKDTATVADTALVARTTSDTLKDLEAEANAELEEDDDFDEAVDSGTSEDSVDDANDAQDSDADDAQDSDSGSSTASHGQTSRKRKRNDPDAFATSLSKILSSKLSTSKRGDPVLARSAAAHEASQALAEHTLEKKARSRLREEKQARLDKGRVRDVLGASTAWDAAHRRGGGDGDNHGRTTSVGASVQRSMEQEKRLRKTAQRGVVMLFNAVRAAQVKSEAAAREARSTGVVGQDKREERAREMSKKGFLELIAGGGGGLKSGDMIEA